MEISYHMILVQGHLLAHPFAVERKKHGTVRDLQFTTLELVGRPDAATHESLVLISTSATLGQ